MTTQPQRQTSSFYERLAEQARLLRLQAADDLHRDYWARMEREAREKAREAR